MRQASQLETAAGKRYHPGMPPLENLSLGKRLLVAAIIIAATLFTLYAVSLGEQQQQPTASLYEGIQLDSDLLELDKRALEAAYIAHLTRLFGVWLSHGAPADAANFRNGLWIARRAYNQVNQELEKREKEIERQQQQQQPR
jgi:hypothetical protein